MTENDQDKQKEESKQQCCPPGSDPGCCSAPQDTPAACCSPSTGSPLKTAIFAAIILAAICVAVISITKKSNREETAQSSSTEQPVMLLNGLESITGLSTLAADKEVVFVLLPGQSRQSAGSASTQVNAAVEMLTGRGKSAAAFTLDPDAEGRNDIAASFNITQFPSVIIAARGCEPVKLDNEISRENLVGAYVKASAETSVCGPGGCAAQTDAK